MSRPSPRAAAPPGSDASGSSKAESAAFRLRLLGPWELTGSDGHRVQSVLSQPKRLCLLAYLALVARPVTRSTVVALFWPDTDEEHARNALSQSLHYLRRSMGKRIVENVEGDRLVVSPEQVDFDVRSLLALDEDSDPATPGLDPSFWEGEFFEGWNAEGSQPLQDWLDATRLRVRAARAGLEERRAALGDGVAPVDGAALGDRVAPTDDAAATDDAPAVGYARTESSPRAETGSESRAGLRTILAAALILLAAALLFAWLPTPDPDGTEAALSAAPVAVLMPRVLGSGLVDDAALEAIHVEIVHRLSPIVEPDQALFSVRVAQSPAELQRILEAQSEVAIPRRVVDVLIRTDGSTARMNASLLTGGGYVEVMATVSHDFELNSEADAIIRLPGEIADLLAREFGEALVGR